MTHISTPAEARPRSDRFRCGGRECNFLAVIILVSFLAKPVVAGESLFERDVLPILTKNCLGCHGGLRQKGGLEMRTIAAGLKGGKTGPAWKSGDLKESEAWNQIASDEMPPNERKLSAAEKEHLKNWIQSGLPAVADRRKNADPILKPGSKHEVRQVATAIDQHVQRGLEEAKLKPMPTIGDAEFLRRIYLDLAGRVPTAEKAAKFLDNQDPDKRAKLIDSLLESKDFASHFGYTWQDWMLPPVLPANFNNGTNIGGHAQRLGVRMGERVAKGDGWDRIVSDILTAQGTSADPGDLNFFQLNGTPNGLPLPHGTAKLIGSIFMGVQLRCAECHDDPYRDLSQKEFWAMSAFFQRMYGEENFRKVVEFPFGFEETDRTKESMELSKKLKEQGFKPSPAPAQIVIPDTAFKNIGMTVQAGFLKGPEFRTDKAESLRPHFAAWLTKKENPYFSKAFANRMWFYFFARGIVQPVDDFRDLNPPSHPELIAMLANEFGDSGFDVKHLLRCICNSETYQRSSRIPEGMKEPAVRALTAAYGRGPMRLMRAEVFYASLRQVYGGDELDLRVLDAKGENTKGESFSVGGPVAEFVRTFCIDKGDATEYVHGIPQRLAMLNHPRLLKGSNALEAFRRPTPKASPDQIVEWLYLSTLSRRPTDLERSETEAFLEKSPNDYMRVLWSLVNRSEYLLVR
ncbi:hypothetical protein LBMAG57_28810 [Verrucomicrobiota bacterium]|nr:hypothetical protein LBMAG57_28810 [Verrucomicrobiota bacterium]